MNWKEIIIDCLNRLGGEAHYYDIYNYIERTVENKKLSKTWKAVVRATIEINSSDSDKFMGKNDLFYSVEGKGKGIWGLRNFEANKLNVDLTEDDISFPEGKEKLRIHIYKERNPKLVIEAKKKFKKIHGKLYCEVCNFNFEEVYGEIGTDYIEVHHTKAVSEMEEIIETKLDDLAILCSNCHRMIHRKRPWLSIEKIKSLINK